MRPGGASPAVAPVVVATAAAHRGLGTVAPQPFPAGESPDGSLKSEAKQSKVSIPQEQTATYVETEQSHIHRPFYYTWQQDKSLGEAPPTSPL